MSRRVMFVLGAEGSGTNMLAAALVSAGCHEDPRHRGYMDDYEFEKMPDLLMFRRSLPHAGRWENIEGIIDKMKSAGYKVVSLLIIRDSYCTVQSVLRRDPSRDAVRVEDDLSYAIYSTIADAKCGKNSLFLVSYESFCLHPEFRHWLFVERLGLKEPTIEIKYANPKYYKMEHELTGTKGGQS